MSYKNMLVAFLLPFTAVGNLIAAKNVSSKDLAFYKNKATECAAKSTSALILDVTKKAAIGAIMGAGAGAAIVGLHALDIYTRPSLDSNALTNTVTRFMPYKWSSGDQRFDTGMFVPVAFSEELIKSDPYYLSRCTNFSATRCGPVFGELTGLSKLTHRPSSEWVVPFETSMKALKTMRWDYLKQNLCLLGLKGAVIGALLGTGYAFYKQYYASTPEWLAQLELLQESDFAPDPIMIGGKAYLVSYQFSDIGITDPSYEFYFMPRTEELVTAYKEIIKALGSDSSLKNQVACVSIRLVPSASYSGTKVLPRIVVQLYPHVNQKDANKLLALLYNAIKAFVGDGKHPRYSSPATTAKNNLIFVAFGSGDMKNKNAGAFERKGSWLWRAADDMAYQNSATQALSLSAATQ